VIPSVLLTLRDNWPQALNRAWFIRFIILAGILRPWFALPFLGAIYPTPSGIFCPNIFVGWW